LNNYVESHFLGKTLKEQVINPNIIVDVHNYYSGYYHKHGFDDIPATCSQIKLISIR